MKLLLQFLLIGLLLLLLGLGEGLFEVSGSWVVGLLVGALLCELLRWWPTGWSNDHRLYVDLATVTVLGVALALSVVLAFRFFVGTMYLLTVLLGYLTAASLHHWKR